MTKIMVVLVSLITMLGCRSEDRIVSFSLSRSDGRRSHYSYNISETKDGKVHFHFKQSYHDEEIEYYTDDHSIFDALDQIVRKRHMRWYRSNYRPLAKYLDGHSWSLYVEYASGKEISSGGYMAGPLNWGKAQKELLECLDGWKKQPEETRD